MSHSSPSDLHITITEHPSGEALSTDNGTAAEEFAEEARLDREIPGRVLRHGGHGDAVTAFTKALDTAEDGEAALRAVRDHGRRLWRNAARRAREGDGDDRPLYWTRLAMLRALRERHPADEPLRAELTAALERSSRGIEGNRLPAGGDRLRVVITGFDPFGLDRDIRNGNPSGAAVLALHGTTLRTADGRSAHVEGVILPVRWRDFTDGIVEEALTPYLEEGPRRVDLFMTLSRGRPGFFDLEGFNGARRGDTPDNAGVRAPGPVPVLPGPDGTEGPQWTRSTLPMGRMIEATAATATDGREAEGPGAAPVRARTGVVELPAGAPADGEPISREDGPGEGSTAVAGSGGDYLSNEVAHRACLLRDRLKADIPGGHLHIPAPDFASEHADPESDRYTDPVLVAGRREITRRVRALLLSVPDRDRREPAPDSRA
ncbi:pyroglutamyl peptidase [Streptomyces sp. ST2-7A]|uniref:pyroglutamyl peptidase n=1 Tax=Streptomyces sp. ST2-7A TaxID=2907214 RepID=UPI001F36FC65|nr:pyroglutamyl peptidase [Streptomyces sp. ST2-7A]MCE7082665.1 pyroglutamyl peptidase [Streptomyces sp. ST2-7A]